MCQWPPSGILEFHGSVPEAAKSGMRAASARLSVTGRDGANDAEVSGAFVPRQHFRR